MFWRDSLTCQEKYAYSKQGTGDAPILPQSDIPKTLGLTQAETLRVSPSPSPLAPTTPNHNSVQRMADPSANAQKWPRYWYIVAVNCDEGIPQIDYKMHFINAGGHWAAEFSYDEQGLIWIYVVFIMIFAAYFLTAGTGLYRMSPLHRASPCVLTCTLGGGTMTSIRWATWTLSSPS